MSDKISRGILVIYMNVGTLPPFKAEALIERAKDRYMKSLTEASVPLPDDISVMFMPVRPPEESFVDFVPFDALTKDGLEQLAEMRRCLQSYLNPEPEEEVVELEAAECCSKKAPGLWDRFKGFVGLK